MTSSARRNLDKNAVVKIIFYCGLQNSKKDGQRGYKIIRMG